jgi:hypothetical protein
MLNKIATEYSRDWTMGECKRELGQARGGSGLRLPYLCARLAAWGSLQQRTAGLLTNEKKLATSTIRIAVAALRFLYKVTHKPQKLPVVMSPEEVAHFLECIRNVKHRTILLTCYAAMGHRLQIVMLCKRCCTPSVIGSASGAAGCTPFATDV